MSETDAENRALAVRWIGYPPRAEEVHDVRETIEDALGEEWTVLIFSDSVRAMPAEDLLEELRSLVEDLEEVVDP